MVRQTLRARTSPDVKIGLRDLQSTYASIAARRDPLPSIWDTGFRVCSEHDEDGILLFLLAVTGTASRRFVDIGCGNGVHGSNCANLAFNLGFGGVLVDADARLVEIGAAIYGRHPDTRRAPPCFVQSFVTRDTINPLLIDSGTVGEVDVLSIDIDGNEYWIWDALDAVDPRIVVVEIHDEYGLDDILGPYDENLRWQEARDDVPFGASATAMTRLATSRGYRLVGGNRAGFNAIYLRQDLAPRLPSVDVAELLRGGRGGDH